MNQMISHQVQSGQSVFVYGSGGHARVIIDILHRCGAEVRILIDDDHTKAGSMVMGCQVYVPEEGIRLLHERGVKEGIIGIGENQTRLHKADFIVNQGFTLVTAIHPSAVIGEDVSIAEGTVAMAGVVVNSGSRIDRHVILNTRCSVDHDCRIGQGAHISPGVCLGGTVMVGELTQIGIGATVLPDLTIGNEAMVGGGAVVIRDVPDNVTVIGMPAEVLKINL